MSPSQDIGGSGLEESDVHMEPTENESKEVSPPIKEDIVGQRTAWPFKPCN